LQLYDPEKLVGTMAHEMAHAWRRVRGIQVTPVLAEEECTDVTAIALGFGILVANEAYQFHPPIDSSRRLLGTYSISGHLEVDDMAGLLACWAKLKHLPPETILKHLGATQADLFRKAWTMFSEEAIRERLGVAPDVPVTPPFLDGATERGFSWSLAAQRAHECMKHVVEVAGEDGGLLPGPMPFTALVSALPHRRLARWGRIGGDGLWMRLLALVADPEWDTQAIVVVAEAGDEVERFAIGHVRDARSRDAQRLGALLAPAFAHGSRYSLLLVPSLPTYVVVGEDAEGFGTRELEHLFCEVADHASPDQVAAETEWLDKYRGQSSLRIRAERAHGGIRPSSSTGRADSKGWWNVVSDPEHTRDERSWLPWYRSHPVDESSRPRADSERDG